MRFHGSWLESRRRFLNRVKDQVRQRIGQDSPAFRKYIHSYNLEFRSQWGPTSQEDLLKSVGQARLVLGADFHAFPQSQRIHLRLLRELPRGRSILLLLEALNTKDQRVIDRYLDGRIDEAEFLRKVSWDKSWGFPWENYRPLFVLARRRGYRILGLDSRDMEEGGVRGLRKRDRHAARVIFEALRSHPNSLLYAIVGDLHLARQHLPLEVEKLIPDLKGNKLVTILQNSEHLYFRLARHEMEDHVEVLKASGGSRYCVLGSPPWVKWQSYLMHLETVYDQDLDETGGEWGDYIAQYIRILARDLGVTVGDIDAFVYSAEHRREWRKIQRHLSATEWRYVRHLMDRDRSFYLPENNVMYLSRRSINHAASLAGLWLQAKISHRKKSAMRFPKDFVAAIWLEAMGFCLSKFINHRRKPETIESLRAQWHSHKSNRYQKDVLLLALGQRLKEIAPRERVFKTKLNKNVSGEAYLDAARILGGMLGERIYRSLRVRRLGVENLVEAMRVDVFDRDFLRSYTSWVARLGMDQS